MTTKTRTAVSAIACAPGALPGGPMRTRFFDGMFLTQADLENEQRYWRIKRRLTNRALGDGVVWGLRLAWDARTRKFVLSPGYAVDCCGNDLVVECPVEITERELWEVTDPSLRPSIARQKSSRAAIDNDGGRRRACVVLQYVECAEDSRPVHRDACDGIAGGCEVSRVRETTRLLLVPEKSPARPSPPKMFWDELIAFRDGLPPEVRELLFPPQAQVPDPAPAPQQGVLPVHVHADVPHVAGTRRASVQPVVGTTVTGPLLAGIQNMGAGQTGVVTFELRPSPGWGFTAGRVLDGDRTVETVTPPVAPSMYWSLDVAVPEAGDVATVPFDFVVDDLAIQEVFGGGAWGRATFVIRGEVMVQRGDGEQVSVQLRDGWRVDVRSTTVVEELGRRSCFSDVVPWGWASSTADGSKITRVLVLSAAYALLQELTTREPRYRQFASVLYAAVWFAMFGAWPFADVDEQYRRELANLIVRLYERWCAGFVYPGPRCGDEHHSVYLGCVDLDGNGGIASFDMWDCRRHVITGPVLSHWARQFGIAPIDVIVGRFAEAICCLANQPRIVLPPEAVGAAPERGPRFDLMRAVTVGTPASIDAAGGELGVPVRWVGAAELVPQIVDMFLRRDAAAPAEVLGIRLPDGGSIGVAVPAQPGEAPRSSMLRDDVVAVLRRGDARVAPRAREPLAALVVEIARLAPVTSVLRETRGALPKLAKRFTELDITLVALAEHGADAALARLGEEPTDSEREAADELTDRAELAVDTIAATVGRAAGASFRRERLADAEVVSAFSEALREPFRGRLGTDVIEAAASRVANR